MGILAGGVCCCLKNPRLGSMAWVNYSWIQNSNFRVEYSPKSFQIRIFDYSWRPYTNHQLYRPIIVDTHKGTSISSLADIACNILEDSPFNPSNPPCVYFVAGLPDITHKEQGPYYQEIIFIETPQEAVDRVMTLLSNAQIKILNANAIPIFSTIAPMSLQTWNSVRLQQQKTSHLLHSHQYEDMQELLIDTTIAINKQIIEINSIVNMHTPKLGEEIIHKPGANRSHRTRYGRLVDGVHLCPESNLAWADTLLDTIIRNGPPTSQS